MITHIAIYIYYLNKSHDSLNKHRAIKCVLEHMNCSIYPHLMGWEEFFETIVSKPFHILVSQKVKKP